MMTRALEFVLRWIVAGAFLYAGWIKIADPAAFLSSILTYEIMPYQLAALTALFVPFVEVVSALALGFGRLRQGAALLLGGLLVAFIVLVAQAWARGLSIDCGCFGSNTLSGDADFAWKIGQNLLLLAALVASACLRRRRASA